MADEDQATVATGRAGTHRIFLDDPHRSALLGQIVGAGQSDNAAADNCDLFGEIAFKFLHMIPGIFSPGACR